ncbi:unannotated protein [freshwater metagenome]|uniref:Unannotated protein n=1 Tax=freshwater metagenome TaxID=449393 RepID=A0A6J7D2P0_9ZZZZ
MVAVRAPAEVEIGHDPAELVVGGRVGEVARNEANSLGQLAPGVFVEWGA